LIVTKAFNKKQPFLFFIKNLIYNVSKKEKKEENRKKSKEKRKST